MVDVEITVGLACDEDTTHDQVQQFINDAIEAALEKQRSEGQDRFAYNGEPFQSWTTA